MKHLSLLLKRFQFGTATSFFSRHSKLADAAGVQSPVTDGGRPFNTLSASDTETCALKIPEGQ